MVWYSILPAEFITVESWAAQTFFLLGLLTIVPWAALVVFDILLFTCRTVAYEIPFVGGRARGRTRPNVFSLYERGTVAAAAMEALRNGSAGGGSGNERGEDQDGQGGNENKWADGHRVLTERNPNTNSNTNSNSNSSWTADRGQDPGDGGVRRRQNTTDG